MDHEGRGAVEHAHFENRAGMSGRYRCVLAGAAGIGVYKYTPIPAAHASVYTPIPAAHASVCRLFVAHFEYRAGMCGSRLFV